jgi:hypothetical protein
VRGKKSIEIYLKDIVTYFRGRDGAVGLISRQMVESVCVHLHICVCVGGGGGAVVHLASSDISIYIYMIGGVRMG